MVKQDRLLANLNTRERILTVRSIACTSKSLVRRVCVMQDFASSLHTLVTLQLSCTVFAPALVKIEIIFIMFQKLRTNSNYKNNQTPGAIYKVIRTTVN